MIIYVRLFESIQRNRNCLIGHAEMEKEIQKTVSDIIRDQEFPDTNKEIEF
jgi:hypothetical protein